MTSNTARRLVGALALASLVGSLGVAVATPAKAAGTTIPTLSCGSNLAVLNTGHDPAGGALALGGLDPVWQASGPFRGAFVLNTSTTTGVGFSWTAEQAALIIQDPRNVPGLTADGTRGWTQAISSVGYTGWQSPPSDFSPDSAVISQTQDQRQIAADPNALSDDDFAYLAQFTLDPSVAPAGVSMEFSMMADNTIAAIFVNGVPQSAPNLPQAALDVESSYHYAGYQTEHAIKVPLTGFQAGLNTILVQVKSAGGGWQALLVSTKGTVACAPVLVADSASTLANTPVPIQVMANDGNLPQGARLADVVGSDLMAGTWAMAANNTVLFTPAPTFVGQTTATYTLKDATDTVLGTAQITATVTPVTQPDTAAIAAGTSATIPVLNNDLVWPGSTVSVAGDPAQGSAWAVSGTSVTFTPDAGFTGTATATYTVTSPSGETATSTVTVSVLGMAIAVTPPAAAADTVGQSLQYQVTLTNTGPASLSAAGLSVSHFSGLGEAPSIVLCTAASNPVTNGQFALDPGATALCTVAYTLTQADLDAGAPLALDLAAAARGGVDLPVAATARAADVAISQHPQLTVTAATAPIQTAAAGQPVTYQVTVSNTGNVNLSAIGVAPGTFTGTGEAPTVQSCAYPSDTADSPARTNGALQLAPGASAVCTVSYTVAQADFGSGALSFTATATGAGPGGVAAAGTSPAVVVSLVESAGIAAQTPWHTPASIDALALIHNLPAGSTVTAVAAADADQADWWSLDPDTGQVQFSPPASFSGQSVGAVTVRYPDDTTAVQQLTVTVLPPTVSVADAAGPAKAGSSVTLTPTITAPDGSTLRVDGDESQGTWTVHQDRSITFTPLDGFLGQASATLTATAPDGTFATGQLSVEVTLTPRVDDAAESTPEGQPVTLTPALVIPDGAVIEVSGGQDDQGTWVKNDDNTVTFTPIAGFTGLAEATMTITGPDQMTDTATLQVTVTPIPKLADRADTVPEHQSVTLRPGVSIPAGSEISVVGDPDQGVWTKNDDFSVTFTPADGFTGPATATFTATAPNGVTATATLSVTVTMVPAVQNTSETTAQGVPVTLRPTMAVPDGSFISVVGNPAQGTWTRNADRSITFTPLADFVGLATATITITGPDGITDRAQLMVNVTMNPVVQGAFGSVVSGSSVTLNPQILTPAGSDVAVVGDPAQGVWTKNADNSVTFTPVAGFTGTATAVLTVTAPNGTSATADLSVTVLAANNPSPSPSVPTSPSPSPSAPLPSGTPSVSDTSGSGVAGSLIWLRPVMTLPTGSSVQVVGDDPTQGDWEYDPDTGTVIFTPAPGFVGQATAQLIATGPDGTIATAELTTNVLPVDASPSPSSSPSTPVPSDGSTGTDDGSDSGPVGTGGSTWPSGDAALALISALVLVGAAGVATRSAQRRRAKEAQS